MSVSSKSVTRAERKALNPMLHKAGLPTLGACVTLVEYVSTLTKAQRVVLDTVLGKPAKPASTGYVRAQIRARKVAHQAREAREASQPRGLEETLAAMWAQDADAYATLAEFAC